MMLLDLKREIGVEGTEAWILSATEFAGLLDLVYRSHFGEVWLYNNDLEIILDDRFFVPIYLERIAGSLKQNIDAVKILVDEKSENYVFQDKGELSLRLISQLKRIYKKGGKNRLMTFYFGKVREARLSYRELNPIPSQHKWVFYTHRADIRAPNYGIFLIRPSEFPFYDVESKIHYAFAWQMTEDHVLRKPVQEAMRKCFTDCKIFYHFKGLGTPKGQLVKGWSKATEALKRKRAEQPSSLDTLAFRESADIAVFASREDELSYLKQLIGEKLKDVPGPSDGELKCECFTIQTFKKETKKVLLGVIGEGNLSSACKTWDVLTKWNPQYVILCGVAGRDPNADKEINIGDVVIGEKVVDYETGSIVTHSKSKEKLWEFKQRAKKWDAQDQLCLAAQKLISKWSEVNVKISGPRPPKVPLRPKAYLGTFGSGFKVIESPFYFHDMIYKADPKIDTVEKEASGVCFACENHPLRSRKVLVVKSIMDMSTSKTRNAKRFSSREYAVKTCGRFIFDLLHNL